MPPSSEYLTRQIIWLFLLSLPVAAVARTIIFEEIFREPREWCQNRSKICNHLLQRKFFYLFTCDYCFSHYATLLFLFLTRFKLLLDDWRGYVISFFAVVLVSNIYLNLYSRLKVDISATKAQIKQIERSDTEVPEPTQVLH